MFALNANAVLSPRPRSLLTIVAVRKRPIDTWLAWADERGLIQADLARRLRIDPQQITNWKKRGMPPAQHAAAAQVFGRTVDELISGEVRSPARVAPDSPQTPHAIGALPYETPPVLTWEGVMQGAHLPQAFLCPIPDDANAPDYTPGMLLIWSTQKTPQAGSLVIVRDRHGQTHMREYRQGRAPGRWTASASNAAFATFDSHDDGLHVMAVAQWRPMP